MNLKEDIAKISPYEKHKSAPALRQCSVSQVNENKYKIHELHQFYLFQTNLMKKVGFFQDFVISLVILRTYEPVRFSVNNNKENGLLRQLDLQKISYYVNSYQIFNKKKRINTSNRLYCVKRIHKSIIYKRHRRQKCFFRQN